MVLGGITDSIDPQKLLETFGLLGLFAIIFAESGLLIGFFLPGDSLLFTAGLFAAKGTFNLPVVLVGCFLAAVIGDQVGYVFGKRVGPSIFRRPNSRLFKQEYVLKADEFFERHGPKTIVLARFVPVVRTFVPVLAGVGKMHYRTFITYNIVGGLLWAVGITTLGYALGRPDRRGEHRQVPVADHRGDHRPVDRPGRVRGAPPPARRPSPHRSRGRGDGREAPRGPRALSAVQAADRGEAWARCITTVARSFPDVSIVGYETGDDLDSACNQGFKPLGPLRVWVVP